MEPQDQDLIEKAHHEVEEIDRLVNDFLARPTSTSGKGGDVIFKDLSVIGAGVGYQLVNNVPEACVQLLKLANPATWWSRKPTPSRILLHKLTGSIREGEMMVVVGRPGSGCTTLLKALANMRDEYLGMEGDVWYGSLSAAEAEKNRPDQIAFVGENDVHFPSLSVSTTLRFALNARRGTSQPDRTSSLEQDLQTVLELMGLSHAADVRIGSDHIRGVSGGQRRRVSLAEAFCTRASLFCFDNPTRGLDSSTAIRFLTVLREYTKRSGCSAAMSLYQASDLAISLFDKVLVLNEGHVAYYGPVSSAKGYFESLGFYCSPRTSVSDFLASMSGTPDGRIPRDDLQRPVPLHPVDFAARFWESSFYQQSVEQAKAPEPTSLTIKPTGYALPFYRQIYECTIRHYRIFMTDRAAWIAEAAGTIVQALLLGTLFRNQRAETEGLYTRGSALFFSVLIMGLQASAEFGNTFIQRPILLKQKALRFYRPGAYALGQILADVPWKLIFILYSLPIYWMIGFERTASHFFTWLVCLYVGLMALCVMFRAIAVFTTSITRAVLPVGLLLNVLIIYTGFYVTPPGMKVWLGWIRYLDPMYYIFESIALNEIGSSMYQCSPRDTVPEGLLYTDATYQTCAVSGSLPGHLDVSGKLYLLAEYGFKSLHKWRNVGINAAFFVFFSLLVTIGMERFRHAAERMSTIYYQKLPWANTSTLNLPDIERPQPTGEIGKSEKTSDSESAVNQLEPNKHVFAWQDLTLELSNGKCLLQNVSGWLQPGSMTALMGMSDTENPADYLLDISADPKEDWFMTWQDSPEFKTTQDNLQHLLEKKDVAASVGSDRAHAASYLEQLRVVTQRAFVNYWRDSDYVLGKIQLNIWMGLMNGLTFLQLSDNLTDSRGRMFSIFVGVITGPVLSLQIEPKFIILRDQFLAREHESHVYHWSVFTISALLVEIPFTLLGGLIYWLLWYYMVGYFTISTRAGYAFLMYELYSLFVASLAQFTAALFPTVLAAQVATGFVWLVVNTFNGPLSPPPLTPSGWRWFYNISPLFYFVEGIGTNAMHALAITCQDSELNVFNSPPSESCGSYAGAYFGQSNSTGYLVDPSATGRCEYCSYADGDQYVKQYDFSYSQRGHNVGIFIGFILFNYTMAVVATYLIFVFKWRKRSS
ncbi:hypothetical protein N7517_004048 [Penicillium concentricum]|uniref:ABC transporter domain-containing protein n=1 Tax=Penicillium concentricum TaxID=293559 RepID=A0A9W9V7W1_9EURO|nr:uncharacterized protein N7517_004048 [Penicillium concentricum]KAJ5372042.1 hypothetical protein N7517_004048 [Penicillium concentricum]